MKAKSLRTSSPGGKLSGANLKLGKVAGLKGGSLVKVRKAGGAGMGKTSSGE